MMLGLTLADLHAHAQAFCELVSFTVLVHGNNSSEVRGILSFEQQHRQ